MSNRTTLMAGKFRSRSMGTSPYLKAAIERTGAKKPSMLYIGAASGENRAFGMSLIAFAKLNGVSKVHWPKLAAKKKEGAAMREILGTVDFVFVGGGDVEEGMRHLMENDVVDALKQAHGRGAVFSGTSAGAIMLGQRWIRWPHEDASDDEAQTFPCMGIVPFSLDTHGENDGWAETQVFAAVHARETKKRSLVYGIPAGGALLAQSDGDPMCLGVAAAVFAALPGKKAHALKTLEVEDPE